MALDPGDILFVGWDSDNNDITFIVTSDIADGEIIYFTDDERDDTAFFGGEQLMEWTVPTGGVAAGSVITINMDDPPGTTSIDGGGSLDYIRGGHQLAGGNEMFWAFQGTRVGNDVTPTNFVAVIGNEADGNDNQTPNLTGTGLTPSNGAFILDGDEDYMEWTGDTGLADPVVRDDLIASVLDPNNWTTADGGGNNNPNGTGFDIDIPTIVCFGNGTEIEMADGGSKPVEALRAGDSVRTSGGEALPIRWIAGRRFSADELKANPNLYPVRISAGALGLGLPKRDLLVSRQHRILVSSKIAYRMFGTYDVLVPAIKLAQAPGIFVDCSVADVTYYHFLLDRHEIVLAEGAPAESLFTGAEAIKAVSDEAMVEIQTIFPDLLDGTQPLEPAAFIPPGRRQTRLVARHTKNQTPLLMM